MRKFLCLPLLLLALNAAGQVHTFTHADTLRGWPSPSRLSFDVLKYDINIEFDPAGKSLQGSNIITYRRLQTKEKSEKAPEVHIDLMVPLTIDSVLMGPQRLQYRRDGNSWFIQEPDYQTGERKIVVYYHGIPHVAVQPPWDGGVIWSNDKNGKPWISVACQTFGASCWYPNKDQQADEPESAEVHITVPDGVTAVSNGRLTSKENTTPGKVTWSWKVTNPINNYNIIPYIGQYDHMEETYDGLKGKLDLSYWFLEYNMDKVKSHIVPETHKMLKSFEHWFGPYPFYEDGFKFVQSPHLGMEHQSAVAYGNGFKNGYLGTDLSNTGWGLKWDFIIFHEAAHEWFGNNITAADIADMWIHEAFATYAEVIYIESEWGKEAGTDYIVGRRSSIQNDTPVIGPYGVSTEGSGDMYTKGANMVHIIRLMIEDDEKFRKALVGMNEQFYHKLVNTEQILGYLNQFSPKDLTKVFDQYLRTTQIPTLSYTVKKKGKSGVIRYKWENCVAGFDMPVKIFTGDKYEWIYPTTENQDLKIDKVVSGTLVDRNFYVIENRY